MALVDSVSPDPLDVSARLEGFQAMTDGWHEGEGVAPDNAGLHWLAATFDRRYPDGIPLPHTYPHAGGRDRNGVVAG